MTLRLTASAVVIISVAVQILFVAASWQEFDSRLSCDRLLYWGEWIECLHGTSHLYILAIELAVGSWLIAGTAMLLGRFLPRYISVFVPAGASAAFIYGAIEYWYVEVTPRIPFGEPTLRDIFGFAIAAGLFAVYLVGPVTGTWLFGTIRRAGELTLKESRHIAALFDP